MFIKFLEMTEYLVSIFHHGGQFARDERGILVYLNGKVDRFPRIDVDLVNLFDLVTLFKKQCFGWTTIVVI